MARSKNCVSLIGNLGVDPKIHTFGNGDKVATFTLATSEDWKDRESGETKSSTEWHNISVQGPAADFCEKYLRKGSMIDIEGMLKTRKYNDTQGIERSITEVVVTRSPKHTIIPCDGGRQAPAETSTSDRGSAQRNNRHTPPAAGGYDPGILDGDIPF
ncbi:MAG: single-stranded DNA-binding protein [Desulfovibrio sp.]|uniref:single-stranded DNA-binding protein n=1 Tax=Desulfovibrio sp. TaxID=885 RepID=UPI00135E22F3|nr:single-stranded DNA-binding protein [Desulfovibrio sp.]MTJ93963.1 single-stranded DNA-binding protein [Desulfovibrio sp.]